MFAFIRGRVMAKSPAFTIIETGNIGYQVFLGESFLAELAVGGEIEAYLHHQVREDSSDLYGFRTADDLELFELLLTVSGVGPKSALGILNLAAAADIKEAIVRGDAGLLTKVSGVGKKTAERLVLELKGKVVRIGGVAAGALAPMSSGSDELDALVSLGYSLADARAVLAQVEPGVTDSAARLKAALRLLARR